MTFDDRPLSEREAPILLPGDDLITTGSAASWATLSSDDTYRYLLGRQWDDLAPWMVVCMLNPSTADALQDDPTIRRVVGFAKRNRFGGALVVNAYALRATNPKELLATRYPVGPRNSDALRVAAGAPMLAKVVAAWGVPARKKVEQHLSQVRLNLASVRPLWTLGPLTKGGHPRHPLYLKNDTPIIEWEKRYG